MSMRKRDEEHLLACQQFLKETHVATRLANEREFLKINNIKDISFFGTHFGLTVITVVL
jgi:hypothetical protein